jgi:hypothetical protein
LEFIFTCTCMCRILLVFFFSCSCASLFAVFHLLPQGIVLFHHSIRGALEVFTAEAVALQQQAGVTAGQLAGLVERHRFLRSVCMFHTLSEEEVSGLQGCTFLS